MQLIDYHCKPTARDGEVTGLLSLGSTRWCPTCGAIRLGLNKDDPWILPDMTEPPPTDDVDTILHMLVDRYWYWDNAAADSCIGEKAAQMRHEVWVMHRMISMRYLKPTWSPTPGKGARNVSDT